MFLCIFYVFTMHPRARTRARNIKKKYKKLTKNYKKLLLCKSIIKNYYYVKVL